MVKSMELLRKEVIVMDGYKSFTQVERELQISRKTLLKHVKIAGMEIKTDDHDLRKKFINLDQIEELRQIMKRIKG